MKFSAICVLSILLGTAVAPRCVGMLIYDNTTNNTFSNGVIGTNEFADDLHMVSGGDMISFQFGAIANGSTQATVRFYTNTAADSIWPGGGSALIHTEVVPIAPSTFGLVAVPLASPVALPQHIWMSVQFNGSSGSVRLFDPPTVGSSHNNIVAFPGSPPYDPFGNGRSSFQLGITIPEPASKTLAACGLLALTTWIALRKR